MQTNKVPSSNKVLFNVNLLNMILLLLFLPELHSLGQTCKILRKEELSMILRRFNTILNPFTAQFYWEFYQTLQHMKAIIVGSCALDMMLGTRNTPPRDLNIVVPHGSLSLMEMFIKDVLLYHSIATGKVITITEPKCLMHPCFNPNCLHNIDVVIGNCDIPPRIMPYSPESIRQQSKYIEDHKPPYKKTFKGLLYTMACTEPLLIDIPLQDGVDQLNMLNKLEVNHWPNCVCLADALYEHDFHHEMDNRGNIYFINNHTNQDYEILLPAEIGSFTCGTKLQAISSHWLGRQTEPNYIDDNTPVKCPLACTMGRQAPKLVNDCWYNSIVEINIIIKTEKEQDEKNQETFIVKDCLSRATSNNTNPDVIIVHTQQLYDIPREQCEQKKNTGKASRMHKIVLDPVASTSASQKMTMKAEDTKMSGETEHAKTNTIISTESTHPPTLLPDYGGLIFRHRRASLHQLNIRDNANNLIMPDRWYSELRQGTLVLFAATMHGYVQKEPGQRLRKTWQLVTKSIEVIDHSNETIEPHYKVVLPTAEKQGMGPSTALTDFKIEKKMHSK
ncbi:hypothetical protein DFH29DRAFT_1004227 [Suillus ampliporus]|nr:hypothetical protein DFH29DRAFT_1004227 [Suillus ampliporus]